MGKAVPSPPPAAGARNDDSTPATSSSGFLTKVFSSCPELTTPYPPLPPPDELYPVAADGGSGRGNVPFTSSSSSFASPSAATPEAAVSRYRCDQLAHQRNFADKRARLLYLIDRTSGLVRQLREANAEEFAIRLPPPPALSDDPRDGLNRRNHAEGRTGTRAVYGGNGDAVGTDAAASCPDLPVFAPDPGSRGISGHSMRQRPSEPPFVWGASSESAADSLHGRLQVLNLDLKLGNTQLRSSAINQESVSSLFDERLAGALAHLDALTQRVADSSSKILVTGDLNAGKSTFVNALLRREILPVDQQPCTTLFCEVLDATQENDGVEEVHAIPGDSSQIKYDRSDPRTFVKVDMRHLEKLIDRHDGNYSQLKIYCGDHRSATESLLHNGIVNIALVDSPGLNRDSLKTTALFARQQEIDVIVFVVSAENHFTLSGKEFLWNAGNEKAHIFIVVNRFDLIRKKDKCRHEILGQIRQLSPHTYEDAENLVHFVAAEEILRGPNPSVESAMTESFARLEQCLRNFVLDKRARSKLLPAKRYLNNLLGDLHAVASWNRELCEAELKAITKDIERDAGAVQRLERAKKSVTEEMERIIEETSGGLESETRARLSKAVDTLERATLSAEWTGILSAWLYALDVRDRLVDHILAETRAADAHAHDITTEAVRSVRDIGAKALSTAAALSEETESVLVPTAPDSMLESHPDNIESKGNARFRERSLTLRVELTDFLVDPRERLGLVNMSVGAVAVVGTKLLGYQNIFSVIWKVGSVVGVPRVHNSRLTWTMIGLAGVGTLSYLLSDVQRTVGRRLASKLRRQLVEACYVDGQAARVARRSRRQLRLAAWGLQNRFHVALEREERKQSSRLARKDATRRAEEWFAKIDGRARRIACRVAEIEVDGHPHELT